MHTKSRAIKSLMAEFTAILLNELPVALDSLCSALKNSDDIELFKILRNETHLSLSEGILVPGHNLRQTRKIMLKTEVIEFANDS